MNLDTTHLLLSINRSFHLSCCTCLSEWTFSTTTYSRPTFYISVNKSLIWYGHTIPYQIEPYHIIIPYTIPSSRAMPLHTEPYLTIPCHGTPCQSLPYHGCGEARLRLTAMCGGPAPHCTTLYHCTTLCTTLSYFTLLHSTIALQHTASPHHISMFQILTSL